MDDTNRARKRKSDGEIDDANQALRQALGKRGASASAQSRSNESVIVRPAIKPERRKKAELLELKKIVDGRVNDWKSKHNTSRSPSTARSVGVGKSEKRTLDLATLGRTDATQGTMPSPPGGGVFRRFVNEDRAITSSRRDRARSVKHKQHGRDSAEGGELKQRSQRHTSGDRSNLRGEEASPAEQSTREQTMDFEPQRPRTDDVGDSVR